jgi:S-adenosylmethionine-dependent methyltransferase
MASFESGEETWIGRLGNLRNTIRQELIRRQVAEHVRPGIAVLDVGCGQGTQAIHLADAGCTVTGVEPSTELRAVCAASAEAAGVQIELIAGSLEELPALLGERRFDLVCAHGVLMYLPDRRAAIHLLASAVRPGGLLSVTVRNGHALAMRPALRGQWAAALAALDTTAYVNELGVAARADLLDDVVGDLEAADIDFVTWYGVRVFNDHVDANVEPSADETLDLLLEAEAQAGQRDPYRWMASQLHLVGRAAR